MSMVSKYYHSELVYYQYNKVKEFSQFISLISFSFIKSKANYVVKYLGPCYYHVERNIFQKLLKN